MYVPLQGHQLFFFVVFWSCWVFERDSDEVHKAELPLNDVSANVRSAGAKAGREHPVFRSNSRLQHALAAFDDRFLL